MIKIIKYLKFLKLLMFIYYLEEEEENLCKTDPKKKFTKNNDDNALNKKINL